MDWGQVRPVPPLCRNFVFWVLKALISVRALRLLFFLLSVLSLLFSVWIYITRRPSYIILNSVIDEVFGLELRWLFGRVVTEDHGAGWVIGSLPAGLWLFSTNVIIILFFPYRQKMVALILILFCVCTEVFQFVGLIPGCFDWVDVVLYFALGVLPILLHAKLHRETE